MSIGRVGVPLPLVLGELALAVLVLRVDGPASPLAKTDCRGVSAKGGREGCAEDEALMELADSDSKPSRDLNSFRIFIEGEGRDPKDILDGE
jgi:hypothetical protein